MNYRDYTAEGFAMDAAFQQWVQRPDAIADAFWQNWLREHPGKAGVVKRARHLVLLANFREHLPAPGEQEAVWARIEETRRQLPVVRQLRPVRRQWRAWAAVAAAIVTIGVVAYILQAGKAVKYSTGFGEYKEIALADGSHVLLNANSTLEVLPDWGWGTSREVRLIGEAFFKVARQKSLMGNRRFVVQTTALDVQVLGTQFNVFSRARKTQVVLNTGKVKLGLHRQPAAASVYMKPNDLVELDPGTGKLTRRVVNTATYSDWTRHEWVLQNTPFTAVAARLQETFGLTTRFADPAIARERMSGVFSTDNLDDLLDALATINQLKVERRGSALYFSRPASN